MQKIGILGGTFDPIHNGHLYIAQQAVQQYNLDKVIFVPNGNPPHKHNIHAEPEHRYKMVELAVFDNPYFKTSRYEIDREGISYTYDTLHTFRYYPRDAELFYINWTRYHSRYY